MNSTYQPDAEDFRELTAVAAGDLKAFERLYSRYEKRVYQYVKLHVFDPALAEEVLVDTMTAVWLGASKFTHTSKVSTWILGIARHKALDAVRRSGRRQHEIPLDGLPEVASQQPNMMDQVQQDQVIAHTRRAMSMLSCDHQEILRLAFYEELPYEEIASLLSIPVNTVKTRVHYAKQQLKKCLEKLGHKELI